MKAAYIETHIEADESLLELFIALLSEEGYEAFEEEEGRLKAFIPQQNFEKSTVEDVLAPFAKQIRSLRHESLPAKNWNEVWEANYPSVEIDNFCQVVPTHRQASEGFTHTLWLDPKMAFGTGHHQTTRLMVRQMKELDLQGKTLLDMGCGTGILAILAKKMGAGEVWAIDIDPWSEENCRENASLNEVSGIEIALGDVTDIPPMRYEIILANINRNVLLEDIPAYVKHLQPEGRLLISGFYQKDIPMILKTCQQSGLELLKELEDEGWVSLALVNQAV